ncbi:MAG: TIGR04149 family rSAM-modified RiPP [Bacteroidetes bacterium]|nr:TIGR04149 family rSAM-modified RiPP [Bacteroidota bacterium]
MKNLKLTNLSKDELTKNQMNVLRGGQGCLLECMGQTTYKRVHVKVNGMPEQTLTRTS